VSSIPNRSSVSIVALCCAGLVSGLVALDPIPAGVVSPPQVQSAVLLTAVAAAELEAATQWQPTESSLIPL
jgi:hypothetical protein